MRLRLRIAVDHVAAFVQFDEQAVNLFGGILQVVVDGYDQLATGCTDAAQQGVMLTVVARQAQTADPGVGSGQ